MAGRPSRKLAVILHADVVGSTTLVQKDETLAHERIQDTFRRFSRTIEAYGGANHELRGDALVAEFGRASDAVMAATAFQAENAEFIATLKDEIQPWLRVGIAIGEMVFADNTVTGLGVVLAQRFEQLADPGGVCIQGAAQETVPQRFPFQYDSLGQQKIKGFDDSVRAYTVTIKEGSAVPPPERDTQAEAPGLALHDRPQIAILPFINMSGDQEQEYFADGITEDIITELSRFRSIAVIARTSAFTYKGKSVPVQIIGDELGVTYVLEGSVRKAGDRVRVSSQLVETGSGKHIWAERFDRDLTDIFEVQDEITTLIVGALEPEVGHAERSLARRRPPENLDAWGHYQRGLDYMYRRTAQDDASAEREFRRAIELDAEFAAPLAGLAYTRSQAVYQQLPDDVFRERITEAIDLATQATALDPGDALAHCALGRALENFGEFDRALEANKTAVLLNPSSATCRRALGFSLLHSADAKASIPEFKLALKMSPRDPERWSFCHGIALALFSEHGFEDALVWVERAISAPNPSHWALVTRAAVLGCLGRKEQARTTLMAVHEHMPEFSVAYARRMLSRDSRCSSLIDIMAEGLTLAGLRNE